MVELKVGRHPSNDIVLSEGTVSKFHAILIVEDKTVIINDLNSRNGIFVNGRRIKGSAQLEHLDIVKLGSELFLWKKYIDQPSHGARSEKEDDILQIPSGEPEKGLQQPPISKSRNYTPLLITFIVIAFLGLAYLIIESNKNKDSGESHVVKPQAPVPTENETKKVETKKSEPEPAPKPQMILLRHAEYEFYDSQEGMSYFSNVYPVMEGKYAFEFTTDYIEGDKYTYYETARDEAASILTLYSNEARETIVVQITGNKSFKVIDGNSWIYKKNRRYQEYLGPGC